MRVLGLSCFYHDAAAALLEDGRLVAACEEERLSRLKHDAAFPRRAVDYCLHEAGVSMQEIDHVVFYEKPLLKLDRQLTSCLAAYPRSWGPFTGSLPEWLRRKFRVDRIVRQELRWEGPLLYGEHHLSHAGSAFYASPFEEAAVLTVDGVGEWTTTACGQGRGTDLRLDREIRFPHSLGLLYSTITGFLGFQVNDDEWKVMGLAPYGQPRFREEMDALLRLGDDGGFSLDLSYFAFPWSARRMHTGAMARLLRMEPRDPGAEIADAHRDLAASLQAKVEEVMVRMATSLRSRTGMRNLCLAGGVALNGVANWKVAEKAGFDRIFVQPAAGDAGGALGAALYVQHALLGRPRSFVMRDAYWGPGFTDDEIERFLRARGIPHERLSPEALVARAADLLARDGILGWFQGRAEFGPRALGARSILASPRRADMKDRINARVKFREAFRPFAPTVPSGRVPDYFGRAIESPFMLLVPPVLEARRAEIPAVVHVDGSARLQSLDRAANPRYHDLIEAFRARTGVAVLLNTSFNVRGEPIVCTPADAHACFLRSGLDGLAMGTCWVPRPVP